MVASSAFERIDAVAASQAGLPAGVLESAISHHLAGRYAEAELLYRRLIAAQPSLAAAQYGLGFMLQQNDRLDEAYALISAALLLDDTQAAWHYNFAILLARQEKTAEAIQAFLSALTRDRHNYFCWTNLGALFETDGQALQAEQAYRVALQIDPDCPDAFYLLSSLCVAQQRFVEAKQWYCSGFVAGPQADKPRIKLSLAYYELGRTAEAISLIDAWLAQMPAHPVAQHLALAYRGLEAPLRCSDAYVESTFDGFAGSFEATLLKLQYSGQQALQQELLALAFAANSRLTLDLGCGTGLSAVLLRPLSALLEGVDLSQGMLDQAAAKHSYDALIKAEIGVFLMQSEARYDLIVCIDTLIYFGALEAVLASMFSALQAGAWLILSTEKLDAINDASDPSERARDYRLNISGRYSHLPSYVSALLERIGFEHPLMRDVMIRMESGMPIIGQVVRVRKPGAPSVQPYANNLS